MYTVADFFTSFFNSITELLLTKLFHYNPLIDNDYYSSCSFKKVMNNKNFFKKNERKCRDIKSKKHTNKIGIVP